MIALAGLILSCSDDDKVTNSEPSEEIMPLAIGNQWTFVIVGIDSLGDTVSLDSQSTTIVGDTVISGQTWYQYQTDVIQSSDLPVLRNGDEGLWITGPDATDLPYLVAKYPAMTGEMWTNAVGDDTLTVSATRAPVVVPAGSFECIEYVIHRPSGDSTINFYAPGTGLIKRTFFVARARSQNRSELQSAIIK